MTKSLSDIIKSNFISFSDQKRTIKTIDNSHPKIIQSSVQSVKDKNQTNEESQRLSIEDLNLDGDFLTNAHKGDSVSYDEEANELGNNQPSLEGNQLIEEALLEIEAMKAQVQQEGYDQGYESGRTEGFEQGYNEGKQAAEEEIQQALSNYHLEQEKEKEKLKIQLIEEYNGYKKDLEPKMLGIIEDLVRKLIGVQSVSKDTIMHLIKCGIDELEVHGDLIIKVSAIDLDYVISRRDELTEELSEKIKVEILRDQQLQKNECVIETEMGTIECSLGTQLEGLTKELKLIRDSLY